MTLDLGSIGVAAVVAALRLALSQPDALDDFQTIAARDILDKLTRPVEWVTPPKKSVEP